MEGAGGNVGGIDMRLEPLKHFAGRFFGEREGKNALGVDTHIDEMQNLLGHHPRFA